MEIVTFKDGVDETRDAYEELLNESEVDEGVEVVRVTHEYGIVSAVPISQVVYYRNQKRKKNEIHLLVEGKAKVTIASDLNGDPIDCSIEKLIFSFEQVIGEYIWSMVLDDKKSYRVAVEYTS